jgi:hypothetical protein
VTGSPALAALFFEDEVEGAAGLGGELLAHDIRGAEGAGFLAFFDEGDAKGGGDFFDEVAAAGFPMVRSWAWETRGQGSFSFTFAP